MDDSKRFEKRAQGLIHCHDGNFQCGCIGKRLIEMFWSAVELGRSFSHGVCEKRQPAPVPGDIVNESTCPGPRESPRVKRDRSDKIQVCTVAIDPGMDAPATAETPGTDRLDGRADAPVRIRKVPRGRQPGLREIRQVPVEIGFDERGGCRLIIEMAVAVAGDLVTGRVQRFQTGLVMETFRRIISFKGS